MREHLSRLASRVKLPIDVAWHKLSTVTSLPGQDPSGIVERFFNYQRSRFSARCSPCDLHRGAKTGHIVAQTTEECKHFFQLFSQPRTTHSKTNTLRHPYTTPPTAATPKPAQENHSETRRNKRKGDHEPDRNEGALPTRNTKATQGNGKKDGKVWIAGARAPTPLGSAGRSTPAEAPDGHLGNRRCAVCKGAIQRLAPGGHLLTPPEINMRLGQPRSEPRADRPWARPSLNGPPGRAKAPLAPRQTIKGPS